MIVHFWIWFVICVILIHGNEMINKQDTAIEILVVTVHPGDMTRYLICDNEIWTSFLSKQDGFINKHNLLGTHKSENNATEVYHIIEWGSFNQWKNIPPEQLTKVNEQFIQAFGYAPDMKTLPDGDGFHIVKPKNSS